MKLKNDTIVQDSRYRRMQAPSVTLESFYKDNNIYTNFTKHSKLSAKKLE